MNCINQECYFVANNAECPLRLKLPCDGFIPEKDYIKEHLRLVTIEVEAKQERLGKYAKENK